MLRFIYGLAKKVLIANYMGQLADTIFAMNGGVSVGTAWLGAVAYTLQIYGQKYTLPVVASLILCLESVFAVLGGVLILGESLTLKETLGCLFMISGVIISNLKFDREEQ